jgi:hypothetical protein
MDGEIEICPKCNRSHHDSVINMKKWNLLCDHCYHKWNLSRTYHIIWWEAYQLRDKVFDMWCNGELE